MEAGPSNDQVPVTAPALRDIAGAPAGEVLRPYQELRSTGDADALLRSFLNDITETAREAEVVRVLSCFKLNPFEHLNLRFDATPEDVKRQYRKISLMVHPDKCRHPRAREAFEVLGKAQGLLLDGEFRAELEAHLTRSREAVLREWYATARHDVVLRVRHAGSKEAMEAAFVATEEFAERWKVKSRELMTEFEWRKRRMVARIKDEEVRLTATESAAAGEAKAKAKAAREWEKEEHREKRVGGWRDFAKGQQKKRQKGELAGVKAPKLKAEEGKGAASFGGPKGEARVERPDEVKRAW